MEMDGVEEDEEMCQEQVVEYIILIMRHVPFFGQRQLPLPPASSL